MDGRDCPPDAELLEWLQDRSGEREQLLNTHLDSCPFCENSLDRLAKAEERRAAADSGGSLLEDLRRQPAPDRLETEPECVSAGYRVASAILLSGEENGTRRPEATDFEVPTQLGQYEILEVLGHGGMGVVYKARQARANRIVALKMILASKHASPLEQLRFQIEAEAVAHLQHPNIVQLYEVGEFDGLPYFSLEFCDGGSLDAKLKTWTPSPAEAAVLAEALARAMHHAHLRGVVHRDLKPANVLLVKDEGGRRKDERDEAGSSFRHYPLSFIPKIADFGLAKKLDSRSDLSRSGAVMGTPTYMAPEQAAGKVRDTGPAADVYALGVLLYELLVGRPPFKGKTVFETLDQVLTQEPTPPSRLRAGVPRDLETICLKCLRKQPGQRYASAEAFADDLRRYRHVEPITARPVGAVERAVKWVRRRPVIAAFLLTAALGVAGIVWKSIDAEQQRGIAEERRKDAEAKEKLALHEAARAKKARDFLVGIFELSDPNNPRGAMDARQILDDAEKRIPKDFADQPELQAELLEAIEGVYAKMTANSPLAMILEVRGNVRLQSTRNASRAEPQSLLYAGDRLSLATGAQVQLVFLSDLHKERLEPGREATVRRKGCEPPGAVRERDQGNLMNFVRLPKGTFSMGGGGGIRGTKTEIKEDFEIAAHTVTQGQWQHVMGENPSYFSRYGAGAKKVKDISDEELKLFPVEMVSWDEVQEFIKKLNENEKKRGRGFLYRLPTEAEWEYACRAGATSEEECSYHFYLDRPTNDLSSVQANFNGDSPHGKAPKGTYLRRTTRVGAYPPNALGLYDMHGNVWQWCADNADAKDTHRIGRGGSWFNIGGDCRASFRFRFAPSDRNHDFGFRLVRVAER